MRKLIADDRHENSFRVEDDLGYAGVVIKGAEDKWWFSCLKGCDVTGTGSDDADAAADELLEHVNADGHPT